LDVIIEGHLEMKDNFQWLASQYDNYLSAYSDEAAALTPLHRFLGQAAGQDVFARSTLPGHVTASALVVRPQTKHILLVLHRGLNLWIFPGGHLDLGEYPIDTALRETWEETGLSVEPLLPKAFELYPLDLECHSIPHNSKKNEPEHWHFDFRYPVLCQSADVKIAEAEIVESRWCPMAEFSTLNPRMWRKLHDILASAAESQ
jgi:8-oxo-dGTP pyrophosphatase MutT (NUDIX family)